MTTHWATIKDIFRFMANGHADCDDDGNIDRPRMGKWAGIHYGPYVLWHQHLECPGNEETWHHEGLGYWVIFEMTEGELSAFNLSPDKRFVEVRERDDGIMQVSWYGTEDEVAKRKAELNELCRGEAEPDDDFTDEDDDTESDSGETSILSHPHHKKALGHDGSY